MADRIKLEPLAMKDAVAFWKDKVKLSPGEFSKLSDAAKVRGFGVSGIAKGAELETVFNSLSRALKDGISFGEFKKECAVIFEKRGWTGKRAWRVDNIFRTNIQTAYNVGRYKEAMAVAHKRPYWMYDAIMDSLTRPAHRAVDGKVFRYDHPFWDTWYPPNGFRCRCGYITLSEREVRRDGLIPETEDPTGTLVKPKTPDGKEMPARLLMPDPGFAHHPGKAVWGGVVDKAAERVFPVALALKGAADYGRRNLTNVRPSDISDIDASGLLPAGMSDDDYIRAFKERYGEEQVIADALGDPLILSLRTYLSDKRPGVKKRWKFVKTGHGETIPLLSEMVRAPYEIWLTPQQTKSGRIRLTKRYICLWKTADKKRIGGLAVFEEVGGVLNGVTGFLPISEDGRPKLDYLDEQRVGVLLYPKRKKGR